MAVYTFESLSPLDFELLAQDLLQAELGVRFESFCSGSDDGIDLRHSKSESRDIVVQCKHYVNTSWKRLLRDFAREKEKVAVLQPQRYIAVTSQRMTPQRKQAIVDALTPYCFGAKDVFGREDLNNLLSRHPEVERDHFKLWLTSVPILQRVLHADIFAEQSSLLESLQRRVCRYVMNPSFGRAEGMLSDRGFCMISGVPGIGKTTLAEILILDHLDRGFECFRIWESVSEARSVLSPSKAQLFYFDDFLGRTGLRIARHKNEDTRLLSFISDVTESENTRLVVTTRGYILNQAKSLMEALDSSALDIARCVVKMEDYTPGIRAHILYNHLHYSNVPREYIESIVHTKAYRDIVRHPNYSPRIVDVMTRSLSTRDIPPEQYPEAFLSNLEHPQRIWETAFQGHLESASQDLLLVLSSLPDRVFIDDLGEAFEAFHRYRVEKYSQSGTAYDFPKALRELEGSFTKTNSYPSSIVVEFHNPSVRDFLESWLEHNPGDLEDLLSTAVFSEQVDRLWSLLRARDDHVLSDKALEGLLKRYVELFAVDSISIRPRHGEAGTITDWWKIPSWPLERFNRLINLIGGADLTLAAQAVQSLLPRLSKALDEIYIGDRDRICELIRSIDRGEVPSVDTESLLFTQALDSAFKDAGLAQLNVEEYRALGLLLEDFPGIVNDEKVEQFKEAFLDACYDDLDSARYDGDCDDRLYWYEEWESAADTLDVLMPIDEDEFVGDEDEEIPSPTPSRVGRVQKSDSISDSELDSMFQSLMESSPDS